MKFVDVHCDTLTKVFHQKENLFENTGHLSIQKLSIFENPIQFFAIFLEAHQLNDPFKQTLKTIDYFYDQVAQFSSYIAPATNIKEIEENQESQLMSALLSIEGGEALEGKLHNLEVFYALGVRAMTLTWNRQNALGDGVGVVGGKGLTDFGKKAVLKMQELGMIVDVSHLNEYGFWDVYEILEQPMMASHSNAYAIHPHRRNLTDDQIRAIAKKGGVIGINLYASFVAPKGKATMEMLLRHMDHILTTGGEDCLGLGCDFDGCDPLVDGIVHAPDLVKVYCYLERQYGTIVANKIFSGNFVELFKKIL